MALPAGYYVSGGHVYDQEGRRVVIQAAGGGPLDPSYIKSGGKIFDANGMEVVIVDNATGGGGGSLPTGGTIGQVLKKNSSTNGDASWGDTAQLSNAAPLANGTASAGTSTAAARDDHVHPAGTAGVSFLGIPIGYWDGPIGYNAGNSGTPANSTLYAVPLIVRQTMTIDRIGFNVTAAAVGGTPVARLGIYTNLDGMPDQLIVDAGTTAIGTTGDKTVTLSQALTTSCWLAFLVQDAATTPPNVRVMSPTYASIARVQDISFTPAGTWKHAGTFTTGTGLPATWTQATTTTFNNTLHVIVRRSA
jgi:hypothetical protein